MATAEQQRKTAAQYRRVMKDIVGDLRAYRHNVDVRWVEGKLTEAQAAAALKGWEKLSKSHIARLTQCLAEDV